MQTFISEVATTFVGDAIALVNGFGRIVTHIVMAPIERIANACDVAGVLSKRATRARRRGATLVWLSSSQRSGSRSRPTRRRSGGLACLRFLNELT